MKRWARRAAEIHDELAELADVRDPRWWLVAGGAALAFRTRAAYVLSDAEPSGDTFIGHPIRSPIGRETAIADALARAHAARAAVRELDGELPEQPLAVTIRRSAEGAVVVPSQLDVAAFAIGDRVCTHRLAARLEDESGDFVPAPDSVPFVTVTLGDEPIATARHTHRRGWTANGVSQGPWLGLGYARGLSITSTCHMVVDGYGHAWLAARIAHYRDQMAIGQQNVRRSDEEVLTPAVADGQLPLAVGWRTLSGPAPRAVRLAYALGQLLHRVAGRPDAPFSPTFQIPVAPGQRDDALRVRRRVIPALASVRFEHGRPEPFEAFAARTRDSMVREASGIGLASRLLSAAQAVPAPLIWKRRAAGPSRQRWLAPFADVIGGRGCVSKIALDVDVPPSVAVSSPARLVSEGDDLGGCVVTMVTGPTAATITWCGSGRAGDPALLDELLALVAAL